MVFLLFDLEKILGDNFFFLILVIFFSIFNFFKEKY